MFFVCLYCICRFAPRNSCNSCPGGGSKAVASKTSEEILAGSNCMTFRRRRKRLSLPVVQDCAEHISGLFNRL